MGEGGAWDKGVVIWGRVLIDLVYTVILIMFLRRINNTKAWTKIALHTTRHIDFSPQFTVWLIQLALFFFLVYTPIYLVQSCTW